MEPETAILTPIGQGGIGVVRVVGPGAVELVGRVFRARSGALVEVDPTRIHYGHIVDDGEMVDEVLVRFVPPDAAEVDCHGGIVAVQRVLECLVKQGATAVEPKTLLDRQAPSRIRAEAATALLRAATPLGVEALLDQLNGALEAALGALPWDEPAHAADALRHLLPSERFGRALWQAPAVAIVGPANAGKSTLFNALAREERMIVLPQPGTTRDAVSTEVAIAGLPVWLVDTAGEREPDSAIEVEAIARSRSAAAAARLVLLLLDGAQPEPPAADLVGRARLPHHLAVLNKADLGLAAWTADLPDAIAISAATGDGLDELCRRIAAALVGNPQHARGEPMVFTERQGNLLRSAVAAIEAGRPEEAREQITQVIGQRGS